ncbi:T-cell-specific surface glycoprotein CD28 homolog [Salminus brasiliensis]|uniref:T-cell-specific surface glycoprotein CD28 homolog n=1 Tax=Salminus brasiliensis TaxID=930266 RepID=UPI003B833855
MKSSWLPATLPLLFLLGSALPEKHRHCKENIRAIHYGKVHGNVSVLCPSFTAEKMTFTLNKNNFSCSKTMTYMQAREQQPTAPISLQLNTEDNSTMFVLHNVTADKTGLYTCTAKKLFPPPLLFIKDEPQTVVIVQEQPPLNSQQCQPHANHLSPVIYLWVGLGVLTIYGLIITYAAILLRSRLAEVDSNQHDYMNMKPKARRRNQGGILHPTRSWYSDNTASIAPANCPPKGWPIKLSQ